jgi:hypothetical protein
VQPDREWTHKFQDAVPLFRLTLSTWEWSQPYRNNRMPSRDLFEKYINVDRKMYEYTYDRPFSCVMLDHPSMQKPQHIQDKLGSIYNPTPPVQQS